jgi:hypothetical protein
MKIRDLVVSCLLLTLAMLPVAVRAQEANSLLKFVTPDAFAAVVAYPSAVAALPEMELMPKEVVTAAAMKEVGFDPLDIQEAIVFAEPPKPGQAEADFCAIIRFKKALDSTKLFPGLAGELAPQTIEGKKALTLGPAPAPTILFYDDKTIFFAPEPMLKKVLKPATGVSPLAAKLRAMPSKSHAYAVVLVPPVREMVVEGLAMAPPLPPPLEALKELPNLVDQVEAHLLIGASGGFRVSLTAADKANATKVQSTLVGAMDFGKEMLLAQARQGDPGDPLAAASAQYAQRISDHYQKLLKPQVNDKQVSLELKNAMDSQVATMGIGVALLLPAVQSAREAARRMSSSNNLKQIALAVHNYHDVYGRFPDQGAKANDGKPGLSWRVHLLPFMEEQELYEQFHLDEPWDSEHNKKLIEKMPAIYRAPGSRQTTKTNYLAPIGEGIGFVSGDKATFATITDGTSNTIMALEVSDDRAVIWTKPDDYEFDPENPIAGLVGLRPGGFQVALFDGSVRFISQNIDPAVIKALFTMQGAEVINLP